MEKAARQPSAILFAVELDFGLGLAEVGACASSEACKKEVVEFTRDARRLAPQTDPMTQTNGFDSPRSCCAVGA